MKIFLLGWGSLKKSPVASRRYIQGALQNICSADSSNTCEHSMLGTAVFGSPE